MAEARDKNETFKNILLELMVSNETLDKISAHMMHMSVLSLESAASLKSLVEQDISNTENNKEDSPNTVLGVLKLIAEDTRQSVVALNAISQVMSDTFELNKSEALKNEEARLEAGKKTSPVEKEKEDMSLEGGLGFWEILLGIGAAVLGSFAGFVSGIRKVLDKTLFGVLGKIKNILIEALGINKLASKIAGEPWIFEPIVDSLNFLSKFFTNIGRTIRASVFKFMRGDEMMVLKELFPWIGKMQKYFGKLVKFVKAVGGIAFKIGSFIGKIAGWFGIIFTVINAVTDAIDEFKKTGDIGAAIEAGTISIINAFTGDLLDMFKSAASWIAGALGFKDVEKFLDSFSFTDIIAEYFHRFVKAGLNMFEQYFQNFIDVFDDISAKFKEGDIIGTILEIFRGWLKTASTLLLDIPKNLMASAVEGLGFKEFGKTLRDFSFSGLFGGTHTKTGGETQTDTKSIIEAAGDRTAAKTAAKSLKDQKDSLTQATQSNPSEPENFYETLLRAYRENAAGLGQTQISTEPSTSGAIITATQADTAEMTAMNNASTPAMMAAPAATKNISNNNSSVTYNSSNMPDRTSLSLRPTWTFSGGY